MPEVFIVLYAVVVMFDDRRSTKGIEEAGIMAKLRDIGRFIEIGLICLACLFLVRDGD